MIKYCVVILLLSVAPYHNVLGDTENIYMNIGGPAYDSIYYEDLPKNIEKTWVFTTDYDCLLSFVCRDVKLSSRAVCRGEELIINDGIRDKRFCGTQFDLQIRSRTNKLTVKLKTSNQDGFINCLVQAIKGTQLDQYRNVESREIDSSEFGIKRGSKGTTCPCGWSQKKNARIASGTEAGKNEFPWMVAIRKEGVQFCGGAIITDEHVLTAAHCTVNKHDVELEVLVGTNNRWSETEGQRIKVKKIIEHNYDKTRGHENDIAILVLKEKIKLSDTIGPVCLTPNYPNITNNYITVMGWGYLRDFSTEQPDRLRKANVRVVDFNTCSYKFLRKFDTKIPSRICTWSSLKDSCMGDSGGPLVWLDPETNRYTQVALVSFGKGCNTANPKVNTAVSHFYEWIQQVIKDTSTDLNVCTKVRR